MRRILTLLAAGAFSIGATWAGFRTGEPEPAPISRYIPAGALLYIQANDFSSLVGDWDNSSEKKEWLKSDNYEAFSRSRLLLRLKDASDKFAAAAGLPPDMNFLHEVAGTQSGLALFDIGKLQFLYVTQLASAKAMESALWQSRTKFETRSAGGVNFFYRLNEDSETEVAFAVSGDYLLLATREDLMTGALQLLNGSKERSIEAEPWWTQTAGASPAGELRMVLNLEKIVPSPYFRSYWVQQNITEMKQYSAAVCDLFRSGNKYREERILLKKSASAEDKKAGDADGVAELTHLVPEKYGFYLASANSSAADALTLIETKILAPHLGASPASKLAPQFQLTNGETGTGSDMETRIDEVPVPQSDSMNTSGLLKPLLEGKHLRGTLQIQSTERDKDGVFVRIQSAVVLLADTNWNDASVRNTIAEFLRPSFSSGQLGLEWQANRGFEQLSGLWTLAVATRGKYFFISDSPAMLGEILASVNKKATADGAILRARFDHSFEREKFAHLNALLEPNSGTAPSSYQRGRVPDFFADNLESLSSTLRNISAEEIAVRESNDKVFQTVTYEWTR